MEIRRKNNVSVVIPTHNRDDLLERAIASSISQSILPAEVIIIDDLNSACTRKKVDEFSERSPIPLIYSVNHAPETGAIGSRNLGVSISEGDILAFLDDDDYWDPPYLETAIEMLEQTETEVVITAIANVFDDGKKVPYKVVPEEYNLRDFFLKNPGVGCSNVVMTRRAFDSVAGYDVEMSGSSDKEIVIRLCKVGYRYSVVKQFLMNHSIHGKNWSRDPGRVVPDVKKFYKKYRAEMNIFLRTLMQIKIARLHLLSAIKRFQPG